MKYKFLSFINFLGGFLSAKVDLCWFYLKNLNIPSNMVKGDMIWYAFKFSVTVVHLNRSKQRESVFTFKFSSRIVEKGLEIFLFVKKSKV